MEAQHRHKISDAAVARNPNARDARVEMLSGMGWKVLSWELRGSVAEEGAAVLPEVAGSKTAVVAAAAAVAAAPATALWVAAEAAVGMAEVGLAGTLVDAVADVAGSVVAAVDGSVATWGAAGWMRPWRGAVAAAAELRDLQLMWQGYGCCVARGVLATSSCLYFFSSPSSSLQKSTLPRQNGCSCLCLSSLWM